MVSELTKVSAVGDQPHHQHERQQILAAQGDSYEQTRSDGQDPHTQIAYRPRLWSTLRGVMNEPNRSRRNEGAGMTANLECSS